MVAWMRLSPHLTPEEFDEVASVLSERCVELSDVPELIRAHTLFNWWPRTAVHEYH